MDALFIDEGFGSLDVLLHLSATDKLVGIISHREELMESIPQQIKVEKTGGRQPDYGGFGNIGRSVF